MTLSEIDGIPDLVAVGQQLHWRLTAAGLVDNLVVDNLVDDNLAAVVGIQGDQVGNLAGGCSILEVSGNPWDLVG